MNKLIIVNVFCFYILLLFSCDTEKCNNYSKRIQDCLANSEKLEFEIIGSESKGFSHDCDPSCLLGAKLPEFDTEDIDGSPISTVGLLDRINVMNFWFIACKPCVAEIPDLNKLVKRYKNDKVTFLAFTRDDAQSLDSFLKKHPFEFNIVPNSKETIENDFKLKWGYPFTIITNNKNEIIHIIDGKLESSSYEEITIKVDSLLLSN